MGAFMLRHAHLVCIIRDGLKRGSKVDMCQMEMNPSSLVSGARDDSNRR